MAKSSKSPAKMVATSLKKKVETRSMKRKSMKKLAMKTSKNMKSMKTPKSMKTVMKSAMKSQQKKPLKKPAAAKKKPAQAQLDLQRFNRSLEAPRLTLKDLMAVELEPEDSGELSQNDINVLKIWSLRAVRAEAADLYMQLRPALDTGLKGFRQFADSLLRTRLHNGEYDVLLAQYDDMSVQPRDD